MAALDAAEVERLARNAFGGSSVWVTADEAQAMPDVNYVRAVWIAGPRRADAAAVAFYIAYYESGFDPRAHNTTGRDDSYGLMQINMKDNDPLNLNMGAKRRAAWGLTSNDQLFDPMLNMAMARRIFDDAGGSFKDWTTYGKALSAAWEFDNGFEIPGRGIQDRVQDALNPLTGIGAAIGKLVGILTSGEWWRRIGIGAAGVALIAAAILLANRDSLVKATPAGTPASLAK